MTEKRVMVGIPTIGYIDPQFFACAMELRRPSGTAIAVPQRVVTDEARNFIADAAIRNKFTYILYIDDDMLFEGDLLVNLREQMEANKKFDVIGSLAFCRHSPHYPAAYTLRDDKKTYDPIEALGNGIVEVDAVSLAGAMVRVSVFEKISKPWFQYLWIDGNRYTEDIGFCRKLKSEGCRIAVNLAIKMGHLGARKIITEKDYRGPKVVFPGGPKSKYPPPPKPPPEPPPVPPQTHS